MGNNFTTDVLMSSLNILFNNLHKRILYYESYKYGGKFGHNNIPFVEKENVYNYNELYANETYSQNNSWFEGDYGYLNRKNDHNFFYYGGVFNYDIKSNDFILSFSLLLNQVMAKKDEEKFEANSQIANVSIITNDENFYSLFNAGFGTIGSTKDEYSTRYMYGKGEIGFNFVLYDKEAIIDLEKYEIRNETKYIIGNERKIPLVNLNKDKIFGTRRRDVGIIRNFISFIPSISMQYIHLLVEKTNVTSYSIGGDIVLTKSSGKENTMHVSIGVYQKQQTNGRVKMQENSALEKERVTREIVVGGAYNVYDEFSINVSIGVLINNIMTNNNFSANLGIFF
ncbi:MAG: hypothetical protein LBT02_04360 [Rickettsiales bacterium]|jgi:hypothetical protein|nr:hypothetical protein [Rickettsiales bacterium]